MRLHNILIISDVNAAALDLASDRGCSNWSALPRYRERGVKGV